MGWGKGEGGREGGRRGVMAGSGEVCGWTPLKPVYVTQPSPS